MLTSSTENMGIVFCRTCLPQAEMNANECKSVAKDHIFFFIRRLHRFLQIQNKTICGNLCNLRIDPSDRIIFPAYSIRTSAIPLLVVLNV